MEAWVHDPVIDAVSVNPKGSAVAALTLVDVNQAPYVTLWNTSDFSKTPKRFRPKESKLIGVSWLSNNKLLALGRQKFDFRTGGKPKNRLEI